MRRLIIASFMLAASVGSWAQSYDPKVAYVGLSGNTTAIYLANQDGTKAVPVYSSKKALSGVDFAPRGGRIAFSEQGTLKVLAYTASNSGIVVNSVATLDTSGAGDPDFSPSGTMILYVGNQTTTPDVREIPAGGGIPRSLMSNMSGVTAVAWFGSGDRFVYLRQDASSLRYDVWQVDLNQTTRSVISEALLLTTDSPYGFREISDLDVARTRDSILVTLNYPTGIRIVEYRLSDQVFIDYGPGVRGHFSSDDSKIVYLDAARSYVNSLDVLAGTTTRLTKKGNFSTADARP